MVQLSCPDAARWQALLSDSAPDAHELESHLATCSRCRELLDDLAVGSSGWLKDAGRLATDTDRDPEMTRTLHRLKDVMAEDPGGPPVPLDFLTPSDQPGILGTLGRYQVLEVIGRGAFGIVLKALDPDLLRPVAIKVLAPYLAPSGTARERFKREARAAAAVSHDHIVTIHAVEEANGLPYLVMEYVTGVSLQGRLDRDGPIAPRDIARIGMQAAQGLAAAHDQGLVHRDVKPANILLENGVERVKLTDFGLARAADDARITQSGVAAGTPLYMSPEQARGDAVDARSDLFSLGSVLYTLATGFPPFRAGSAMGVLHRIINDPPRPIRDTIPDFPPDLEAIIMQLLEKDPAKRFQLAADVSFRLSAYLARPHRDPAAGAEGESGEGSERERTRPWVVALLLLAAAAMVVVVLTFRTSRGTLVVEVNDPGVKVALDGEELTITGAGPQEVRLKPGTYHVTAAAPDGKVAKVSPAEIVTIKKDGKEIVKVSVEPAAGLPPVVRAGDADSLLDARIKNIVPNARPEVVNLMRQAWLIGRSKLDVVHVASDPARPQTHPLFPRLKELMLEAGKPDADGPAATAALKEASALAELILKETVKPTGPKTVAAPKTMDPEWEAKLDPLMTQFQDLARRLAGTPAGPLMLLPPVSDPDKAVASVKEADREKVKRLLALRDQFALLIPRAQAMAVRLHDLKDLVANNARASARQSLEEMYSGLVGQLRDMEKIAADLGAKPYQPAPAPRGGGSAARSEWEDKLKKLTDEFQSLADRVVKTTPGRVLQTTGPGADYDKATAGMEKDDAFRAKRLLVLRDEFGRLVPEAQKGIGRWEKAKHEVQVRDQKADAGTIPITDLESARIELTDAERAITAAEDGMTKVLTDLKKLADEIAAAVSPEGEFKKVMAEFDALVLRLAKHPVGRVMTIVSATWNEGGLEGRGYNGSERATAVKLLNIRDEIKSQAEKGEATRLALRQSQDLKADDSIRLNEQELKTRTETIRGLLADLKKLANDLDPPDQAEPPLDADLKKVMAEYDAIVLRLARHPVGRVMTLVGDKWKEGDLERRGLEPPDVERAMKLLKLREEIKVQAQKVTSAVSARRQNQENLAKYGPGSEESRANLTDLIHLNEQTIKVGTETVRGLMADLKKLADEIDPPPTAAADAAEAAYNKVLAEYDALVLRLVNTPTGRVLALTASDAIEDSDLKTGGVPDTGKEKARQLLALRAKILTQKSEGRSHIDSLHAAANRGQPGESWDIQGLKFRTGALRGLVDDLKKVADELDPPKKAGPTINEPGKTGPGKDPGMQ